MTNPIARTKDIVVQKAENELLVYDLQHNTAICLNETSSLVWKLCDGKRSVSDINEVIAEDLKTVVSQDLIWLALDQLSENGLLDNDVNEFRRMDRVSRREIIRKVGIASAIAIPAITGIVAPTAASAQSGCLPVGVCLPPTMDICNGCETSTINLTGYLSTDTSCTGPSGVIIVTCSPSSTVNINGDFIINSIT